MGLQFKGAKQRADGWYELGLFVAWHMAMWSKSKTLPEWKTVMSRFKSAVHGPAKQTPAQMGAMLRHLSETYGLQLKVNGKLVSQGQVRPKAGKKARR